MTTDIEYSNVQTGPRLEVEDAWASLNRRYAIGVAVLAALLVLLWLAGWGPGAWRGASPTPGPTDHASREAGVGDAAASASASAGSVASSVGSTGVTATSGGSTPAAGASPDAGGAVAAAPSDAATNAAAVATAPVGSGVAAPAKATAAPEATGAKVRPVPRAPVARLYFDPDQAWPSGEVGPRLAPVLARLKAEPDAKALISGYHDGRGATERNATLALRRAKVVRKVLIREGVAAERIVLAAPQRTHGTGSGREARRVEVTLGR